MAKNDYVRKMQVRKAMIDWQQAKMEEVAATKAAERALWMGIVALNRAFGIGKTRIFRDYVPVFEEITREYEKRLHEVDRDYADGKLEQEVGAILDGDVSVGARDNEVTVNVKNIL